MRPRQYARATLLLAPLCSAARNSRVAAQSIGDPARARGELAGEGWAGFTDFAFLERALLALSLATLLGALLAFLPGRRRAVDSVDAANAPKVFVLYSVIGAAIGIMVLEYGLVVGFVVFGIGGLTRFRTALPNATDTGRLILITLVGLSCGLDLPHLAVLTATFGFVVLMVLDARTTHHIEVRGLDRTVIGPAAQAYRNVLQRAGCRIAAERKSFAKEKVAFIVHAPHSLARDALARRIDAEVPDGLRGEVDWAAD